MVVERLQANERLGYAQVLLRLAEAISDGLRPFPSAVPVVSRASEIKTRVTLIKHYRHSSQTARAATVACILLLGFLTFTRAREGEVQTKDIASSSPDTSQLDVDLIKHEFKTAGYSLPENVLDDLVQETIKKEFGDRATLTRNLQDRGMTYKQFREQIKERLWTELLRIKIASIEGATNATLTGALGFDWYLGNFLMNQNRTGERLAFDVGTNQGPSRQKVDAIEIRFVGPKSVKEAEVRRRIRTQAGQAYKQADIDDDVRSLYATGLFYNVRVSTEFSPKGTDLIYNVQCNPRIAKLKFTGNSKFSDAQLQKLIRSKGGDVFNERQIFSDTQAIRKAYENAGLKGTGVKYSYDVDQPTGEASVVFEINEKN
jgi:hypothetical protein